MSHGDGAAFWDQMYRRRVAAWSGAPNALLAESVEGLAPGAALDVGCGEGADALWLAKRGWTVTAVDISNVALERARMADAAHQVTWLQADLRVWRPPTEAYDLVSAHFLHVPPAERTAFFGGLAESVRPGGTLLVVAHHPSDLETTIGRPPIPDLYFTAEEVAASLAPGPWEVLFSGTRPRSTSDREGRTLTIHDMVLKARRLP
ncbi:class I SAM-dependent methyltransferase [Myxococcaceae bacterium GXIMD 01537]